MNEGAIGDRIGQFRRRFAPGLDLSALEPSWHRSRGWWSERSLREQLLIGGLAAMAILALLLVGVIVPLRGLREAAYAKLHDAAFLDAQLRQGGTGLGQRPAMRRGTPSAILTDSAAAARLSIQRMEPEGGNTRIDLGDAPFGQVMTWIADVERNSRLRVQQAQIDQKGAPGVVSASFVFSG
jgi:general secretion pathway protein M